jgi:hypothetical protein
MVPADPAGMALADGQGQVGPVAKDASQRGVLAHSAQELAGIARLPGTCRRKAFASWLRLASAGAWFTACRRMAFRSAWLNATGLPCMLLEVAALAAISPACCGPMPNAARPGTASWVRVCRIQASPSWIEAAGWPVSSRAVRSQRSTAGWQAGPDRIARTLVSKAGASSGGAGDTVRHVGDAAADAGQAVHRAGLGVG